MKETTQDFVNTNVTPDRAIPAVVPRPVKASAAAERPAPAVVPRPAKASGAPERPAPAVVPRPAKASAAAERPAPAVVPRAAKASAAAERPAPAVVPRPVAVSDAPEEKALPAAPRPAVMRDTPGENPPAAAPQPAAEADAPSKAPSKQAADARRAAKKRARARRLRGFGRLLFKLVVMLVYAALFAAVVFGILRHYKNDTAAYEKTYYTIQTSQLESNIRIVLLSDLHLNQFGENNDTLVQDIARLAPDMIAVVGDMNCQDNPDVSVVLSLCERLVEIAPTYYSYGNHEVTAIGLYGDTLQTELEDRGVNVVNNRILRETINGNPVAICGLTYDPESYKEAGYIKKIMERFLNIDDAYTILLAHYPDYFCEDGALYYSGINLALCGHAHGGQARVPLLGGLYANGQGFLPDLTEGVHGIYGGGKVVVSRGLGDGSDKPPRINNPYELVVLDVNWY